MRKRPALLFALLIQIGLWLYLWTNLQSWDQRFRQGWMNDDRTALYVDRSLYWYEPVRNQFMRFDLKERSWKWISRRTTLVDSPECPPVQAVWELKGPKLNGLNGYYRAELFDRDTHETITSREIELPRGLRPYQFQPKLQANRFLVNVRGGCVDYLDLDKADAKLETLTFATKFSGGSHQIDTSYGQTQLIVETTPEGGPNRQSTQVDWFRFLANGQLVNVRSWQTYKPGRTTCYRELLVTIPMDSQQIEIRSLEADDVVEYRDYPPNFNPTASCSFHATIEGPVLWYNSKAGPLMSLQWDALRSRSRPSHPTATLGDLHFGSLADSSLQIYRLTSGIEVWDPQLQKTLFHLPFVYDRVCLLDKNTLLYTTSAYGISFYYYDVRTGRCTGCYRPFAAVTWLCCVLLISFTIWAYLWMRASAQAGGSPWLDILLVLWLPGLACLLFASEVQAASSGFNWLASMGLGFSMGGLAMAVGWAMLMRDSLWKRCWPLIGFEIVNLIIFWVVPGDGAVDLQQLLWFQHFPLCCLMLYLQCMRMLQSRLSKDNDSLATGSTRPKLSDFFLLTLCVAMVLGLYRLSDVKMPAFASGLQMIGLLFCFSLLLSMLTNSLSKSAFWFGLSYGLTGVILVALLIEVMLRWTLGWDSHRILTDGDAIRAQIALAAATFVGCLPHRWRGVRW